MTLAFDFTTAARLTARNARPDVRRAIPADIAAIETLIARSVAAILPRHYSAAEMDALWPMTRLDPMLVDDGTYFVAEVGGRIVGCGGWSVRSALRSPVGDRAKRRRLRPGHDRAAMRAFYTDPALTRRGIGLTLLRISEDDAAACGFTEAELIATLAGERLYLSAGWRLVEPLALSGAGGVPLAARRMRKALRRDVIRLAG